MRLSDDDLGDDGDYSRAMGRAYAAFGHYTQPPNTGRRPRSNIIRLPILQRASNMKALFSAIISFIYRSRL